MTAVYLLLAGVAGVLGGSSLKLAINWLEIDNYHIRGNNYILEIIRADLEEAGSEDVFRKIKKDFQTASITIGDSEIRDQMDRSLLRAKEDFK